jgi:hypothetical protein
VLDGLHVEDACHEIIAFIDGMKITEPEKLAALLAATYSQKYFMLEHSEEFAKAVPVVERLHEETMEALRGKA